MLIIQITFICCLVELQFSNDYHTLQLISTAVGKMRMSLKCRTQIRSAVIYALFHFIAKWCRKVTHYPTCLSFTYVKGEIIKFISAAEVLCSFNVIKLLRFCALKASNRKYCINRIIPPWNMQSMLEAMSYVWRAQSQVEWWSSTCTS